MHHGQCARAGDPVERVERMTVRAHFLLLPPLGPTVLKPDLAAKEFAQSAQSLDIINNFLFTTGELI